MSLFGSSLFGLTIFVLALISSFPLFRQAQANTGTIGVYPGGPLIFFVQSAGVNRLSVEQAGAQTLPQ